MGDEGVSEHGSFAQRTATLIGVVVPFLGLFAAIILSWGWGFTWVELVVLLVMYLAAGFGVTVGFHRLFAHRAFETRRPVTFVLGVLGSMAMQGPLFRWVATHRRHHRYSDQPDDPHSPHHFGDGFFGVLAGWWHAHVGWIFGPQLRDLPRYVRDLQRDRLLRFISRYFGLWVFLGLLAPTIAGGLLTWSWKGALLGFLWGGLVRIFLGHHATWSINSICHLWGGRAFPSRDESRNNFLCGVLALGEGWHNNHHAFPSSARHGMRWWQIDASYFVIRVMKFLGLAWGVRLPTHESGPGNPA